MSITGALASALSGLNATSRATELVSSNVANAQTEGYGKRILNLSSLSLGGQGAGVRIGGVTRAVDHVLIADRRLSDAELGFSDVETAFRARLEELIGLPGNQGALSDLVTQLDVAFTQAASDPGSDVRLGNVVQAAQNLTDGINQLSDQIQNERMRADASIAIDVGRLNGSLAKIADLNARIRVHDVSGRDAAALMDQRQQLIDSVSELVPLHQIDRGNGQVALYTKTGAQLLDGTASEFAFNPVGTIVPEMSLASGALSGLTLNGQPVNLSSPHGPIAGGALAAKFAVRDEWAPAAQAELDALARDVIERFDGVGRSTPGLGLFTDNGGVFDPTTETGLSGRLQINTVVDPAQGGALWRLRSGLDAVAPAPAGNSDVLNAFAQALGSSRTPASGSFSTSAQGLHRLSTMLTSSVSAARQGAEVEQSFLSSRHETLRSAELATGVDPDEEMQKLLVIEQNYAANARVIQTIEEMIQILLRL